MARGINFFPYTGDRPTSIERFETIHHNQQPPTASRWSATTLLLPGENNEHELLGRSEHIPRYFVTTHWQSVWQGAECRDQSSAQFSLREKYFLLTFPLIERQGGLFLWLPEQFQKAPR